MRRIVVGSRESKLAIIECMTVMDHINETAPDHYAEILTVRVTSDRTPNKEMYLKELELALKLGRVDLTVHSLRDVPLDLPPELPLVAFSKREDARNVLVLPEGKDEIDPKLSIGTPFSGYAIQLQKLFPDHKIELLRGNLQTQLKQLDMGEYGALVLAAAGLKRLGLERRISRYFTLDEIVPVIGQGIIAVQGRANEDYEYLEDYDDRDARRAAICERAYVRELKEDPSSPVCVHAEIKGNKILLRSFYEAADGTCRMDEEKGSVKDAEKIGKELARKIKEETK